MARASGINPIAVDDTMIVEGRTNLRPDDNSITVELLTEDGDSVALTTTDEWGYDGRWRLSIILDGVTPGSYTLEADDAYGTDTVEIEIVRTRTTPTPATTPTERPTSEPTPEPTATDTPTPTAGGGPGFGVLVVVAALVVASLSLAARRRD